MKIYRIATIPGDGIGKEVVPEGMRVINAAAKKAGIHFDWQQFPWSCAYHKETGRMMPENGLEQIRHHDAIFLVRSASRGFPIMSRSGPPDPDPSNIRAVRECSTCAIDAGTSISVARP